MGKVAAIFVAILAAKEGASARDRNASAQAFLKVYQVMQHPRCMNCHPAGDRPLHGDDSHPHSFQVKRGPDGHGLPGARCLKCHQAANQPGKHKPPGAPQPASANLPKGTPRWHLPKPDMPLTFEGRSPDQLCRQLLNPLQNGRRTPAALIGHVEHDPFVAWAWNPGEGRTRPPGTHSRFVEAVKTWLLEGSACPSE